MTKSIKIILIGLILVFSSQMAGAEALKIGFDEDPLLAAFKASGAQEESLDISGWAVINHKFLAFEEQKAVADKAAKYFEVESKNLKPGRENDSNYRIYKLKGLIKPGVYLNILITSVKPEIQFDPDPETYMVITLTAVKGINDIKTYRAQIKNAFKDYVENPELTVCLTGKLNGRLSNEETGNIVKKTMDSIKAARVEGIVDERIISISGYTPYIQDFIEVLNRKININIALRYNSDEDKTFIWIGSPIIAIEY
ncbi:MAG: hypothetical protein PWQ82_1421 [Thermosediminibacterales bacterium]|nr:hypothetical protein [Thermosediminibacterales bacterium]MDK2835998.1 hypothetical protein [Thermosediminibacterales bacterium]